MIFAYIYWLFSVQFLLTSALQHTFNNDKPLSSHISMGRIQAAKGGVKVYVLLDSADYMPSFVNITEAKSHDSAMSKELSLKSGTIIALDRGYLDFDQFHAWDKAGVIFVTRMKNGIRYKTTDNRGAPDNTNVVSDEEIELTGKKTSGVY